MLGHLSYSLFRRHLMTDTSTHGQQISVIYNGFFFSDKWDMVGDGSREGMGAGKASRYLKAWLKQADVGYKELARRLNEHGLQETEDSISSKLARGTFAATFFLACLAVLEGRRGSLLEDL